MTQTATILGAVPRQVTRKSDGQSFTLNEVFTSLQADPFIARGDVFNLAKQFLGQQVEVVTRSWQNDRGFMQHNLDFIGPVGGGGPVQQAQQAQQQTQQQPQTQTQTPQQDYREVERRSIHRQKATAVAADISKTPGEFWGNVNDLIRFYETGQTPMTNNPDWTTGQAMAEARAGGTDGYVPPDQETYPYGDQDVPF